MKFGVIKNRFSFLDKTQLVRFRLRAMRAGVWYKNLPRIDRVLIDLTIRVADGVRSASLARCVFAVTRKLEGLLESRLVRSIREFGVPLARKLSLYAEKWGNSLASSWSGDAMFARFLAVMHINGNFGASV